MSESFGEFVRPDVRALLLRFLAQMPSMRSNSSVLTDYLQNAGHLATRTAVKEELRWLADHGLLTLDEAGSVLVAVLTERGQAVLDDDERVAGIKRMAG